ncbi:hypothetical protein [Microterricola viridarii]|uniref:Uncharacterized protein n=1 Tax=Microterricola viridarii TaxID=412690 RepID=A0A0X8E2K0_9MICO|nr:hypothetical protein [Microterricola viridarii]AMB58287.1 hypothetical protein AWU67_04815 [Microterricola viridarii]
MAAETGSAPAGPIEIGRAGVIVTVILLLGQGLLAIVLTSHILWSANELAGVGIGRDELRRFGDGPKFAFASVWLMPLVGGVAGFALLISPVGKWAWLAPVGAMLISIALCLYFISTFDYVPPRGG